MDRDLIFHQVINNDEDIRDTLKIIEWKPSRLKAVREELGISKTKIADIMLTSHVMISNIESGTNRNPVFSTLYGIILERLYALKYGMVPSFRKIGTSNKVNAGDLIQT